MQILKQTTTIDIPGIGPVQFEPMERAGQYWRYHYGRTHEQSFSFTAQGRVYWGEILRTLDKSAPDGRRIAVDVRLMTRTANGQSRQLPENVKADWRAALCKQFRINLSNYLDNLHGIGGTVIAVDEIKPEPVRTVDVTPTWAAVMPTLLAALENGTAEGKRVAREELMRLAKLADDYNAKGSK